MREALPAAEEVTATAAGNSQATVGESINLYRGWKSSARILFTVLSQPLLIFYTIGIHKIQETREKAPLNLSENSSTVLFMNAAALFSVHNLLLASVQNCDHAQQLHFLYESSVLAKIRYRVWNIFSSLQVYSKTFNV